jgi:transient receptor potential cation channel subfamily V protein 6
MLRTLKFILKVLKYSIKEFWRYSNITCSAYPLEGLDTIDSEGKIAWNSALSYIVNGDTDDHLDMLEIGVVNRLLKDKWSTYAQVRIIFIFYIFMILITNY